MNLNGLTCFSHQLQFTGTQHFHYTTDVYIHEAGKLERESCG